MRRPRVAPPLKCSPVVFCTTFESGGTQLPLYLSSHTIATSPRPSPFTLTSLPKFIGDEINDHWDMDVASA